MLKKTVILLIRQYQKISALFPPRCRFFPTCSSYAAGAIDKFGLTKGIFLAVKRVLKCNPWNPGGYDPVP